MLAPRPSSAVQIVDTAAILAKLAPKPKVFLGAVGPVDAPLQPEVTRTFDLIHTRLEVEPNWALCQLKGVATITLKPHFYPSNQLVLDAKGFDVRAVERIAGKAIIPLTFLYDGEKLVIALDSTFSRFQTIKVEIDYTAKPNTLKQKGKLEAISDDKGLFFINPMGTVPGRARMLWTQGEPQSASCWFPTLDSPNQKSTQETHITVDSSYTTVSNGTLQYSTALPGGKKTDVWSLALPHAPYLFMIAVGPFGIVKDKWKGMEVSYYLEKAYLKDARTIFGKTPEMIEFFSNRLKYPYPWPKYSQIVVRDYVSGAMENTTASIFTEDMLYDARQKLDQDLEPVIAHELFHHWFGDLTTSESWANLSLNESFANYSEYLWADYKYGKDAADKNAIEETAQYLNEAQVKREPLIRYRHRSPNDVFDSHTYAKGGRILHMLRLELGDEAFFESLSFFLKKHQFKKVEVQDLRLAFEEVSGRDLNWFFDQWYFKSGHPELTIQKTFTGESILLSVSQIQDTTYTPIYTKLPLVFDVYANGKIVRHYFTTSTADTTIEIKLPKTPDAVVFNPEFGLLSKYRFERSIEELQNQFLLCPRAFQRVIVLPPLLAQEDVTFQNKILKRALADTSLFVREAAIYLALDNGISINDSIANTLKRLALRDPSSKVRTAAIGALGALKVSGVEPIFQTALKDQSYEVEAEAINQLVIIGKKTDEVLKKMETSEGAAVSKVVAELYGVGGKPESFDWFRSRVYSPNQAIQFSAIDGLVEWCLKTEKEADKAKGFALLDEIAGHSSGSRAIKDAMDFAIAKLKDNPKAQDLKAKMK